MFVQKKNEKKNQEKLRKSPTQTNKIQNKKQKNKNPKQPHLPLNSLLFLQLLNKVSLVKYLFFIFFAVEIQFEVHVDPQHPLFFGKDDFTLAYFVSTYEIGEKPKSCVLAGVTS